LFYFHCEKQKAKIRKYLKIVSVKLKKSKIDLNSMLKTFIWEKTRQHLQFCMAQVEEWLSSQDKAKAAGSNSAQVKTFVFEQAILESININSIILNNKIFNCLPGVFWKETSQC
jgi:hypothetical protein